MGMPSELVKSAHIQVHPRPTESETLEVRSNNMHFNKSPNARSSLRTSSPENNQGAVVLVGKPSGSEFRHLGSLQKGKAWIY